MTIKAAQTTSGAIWPRLLISTMMLSSPKPGKTMKTGVDPRRVQQVEGYMLKLQHQIPSEPKTDNFGRSPNPHILVWGNSTNRRVFKDEEPMR